jgi:transposase-like protein
MSRKVKNVNPLVKKIFQENDIQNIADAQSLMKDMFKDMVSLMLEAEMDETLGYSKYERNTNTDNSRNGNNQKKVKTSLGEVELDIPRDREGTFEPQVVPKYSRDISDIEDKIISMYGRGMSTTDINDHLEEIYGMSFSSTQISRITDKVIEESNQWKSRPLKACYPFIFLDATHFNVKTNGKVINKAAYIIVGIDLEGKKDILSITVGENESSKFWLKEIDILRSRGVEEIFIASVDGLPGFKEAINTIYPNTKVQRCIVHQIRNTLRFLNYKERKLFAQELKDVYRAHDAESGFSSLERLKKEYPEYSPALKSWYDNWNELSHFFEYPQEIRKIIYTTNTIESVNSQLKKVSRSKAVFPTDDSLQKVLYLASKNMLKKWTQKIRGWEKILRMLVVVYPEKMDKYLI